MNRSKLGIGLAAFPVAAIANINADLQRDEPGGGEISDWLMFLVVLFVVLMVAGKMK